VRTDGHRRCEHGQASVEAILILPFLLSFVILARESAEFVILKEDLIISARTNAFDQALNDRCRPTPAQLQDRWFPPSCSDDSTEARRFLNDVQRAADDEMLRPPDWLVGGPENITRPLRNVRGPLTTEAEVKAPFSYLATQVPDFMQGDQLPLGWMLISDSYQVSANRVWVSADDRDIWHDREKLEIGYDRELREKLNGGPWELRRTDRFFKHLFPKLGRP